MSTIVVVAKDGVATIAADSLTTWGTAKESAEYVLNHQKIIQVGNAYLAISGATSLKLAMKDYFATMPEADLTNVDAIFRTWISLHGALKNKYFLNPVDNREDSFESSQADVLIASPHGIFGVAAHRAVQQFTKFYAYGTGWQHALGAMFAVYSEPGRSTENIARTAIEAASAFDTDTGLPVVSYSVPLTQ